MADINNGPTLIINADKRTWIQKNDDSRYRHVHNKEYEKIRNLPDFYSDKIKTLNQFIVEEKGKYAELRKVVLIEEKTLELLPEIMMTREQIVRLGLKQLAILGELDGRFMGKFKSNLLETDPFFRDFHWTDYFLDLLAGNDGNTGLSIAQAWRTYGQYCTVTVRTAGDIGYIRANTTQVMVATQATDEDGDQDDYISLIGCNASQGIDPFGDGSNVNPIANFNTGAIYWNGTRLYFWNYKNLDFRNSTTDRLVLFNICANLLMENIKIYDLNHAAGYALYLNVVSNIKILNSILIDNRQYACRLSYGTAEFNGCDIDGNDAVNGRGFYLRDADLILKNCNMGQNKPFQANNDFFFHNDPNTIKMENTKYNDIHFNFEGNLANQQISQVFSGDDQQVEGAHKRYESWMGDMEKKTASLFANGADSYAEMLPKQWVGANLPLKLSGNNPSDRAFRVWCTAGNEITLTCKMRAANSGGAWVTPPINTELYFTVEYLDHATDATRTKIKSTQVIAGTAVTNFTVTFTPLQDGWAFGDVILKLYESATKGIDVDIKIIPEVT